MCSFQEGGESEREGDSESGGARCITVEHLQLATLRPFKPGVHHVGVQATLGCEKKKHSRICANCS